MPGAWASIPAVVVDQRYVLYGETNITTGRLHASRSTTGVAMKSRIPRRLRLGAMIGSLWRHRAWP